MKLDTKEYEVKMQKTIANLSVHVKQNVNVLHTFTI